MYETSDESLINELVRKLKKSRLKSVDLAVADGKVGSIVFCGISIDSNGIMDNAGIAIYDRYIYDGVGNFYDISNYDDISKTVAKIKESGIVVDYDSNVDNDMRRLTCFFGRKGNEVAISENSEGIILF